MRHKKILHSDLHFGLALGLHAILCGDFQLSTSAGFLYQLVGDEPGQMFKWTPLSDLHLGYLCELLHAGAHKSEHEE